MLKKAVIIDGYLDEPSCLGVPPYISPHVRYTFGAMVDAGLAESDIDYWTIDQLRANPLLVDSLSAASLVTIIAGTTVPGRYLGGKPISLREINDLSSKLSTTTVLSGPITQCGLGTPHIDVLAGEIPGDQEFRWLSGRVPQGRPVELINRWSILGAGITKLHPRFPRVVCELETYRGCLRVSHCLFCSEQYKKVTYQRNVEEILAEVAALAQAGNRYFRLGAQTDLLLYQSRDGKPNSDSLERLFSGIRQSVPGLKVLHIDNINPATIADNPVEAEVALAVVAKYNTPGDTAAFGLESADPAVLKANNIGTDPEKTMYAIEVMNRVCGWREQGLPKLLPGINFLHGLKGETKQTMELNLAFLRRVLEQGLLLRRINVRQVIPPEGYNRTHPYSAYSFSAYKERINREINQPLLRRVFPAGTLLREVFVEEVRGEVAFGRQLGTYPILVGVPGRFAVGDVTDVKVVDYGFRSLTALSWPLNINRATIAQLEALPGFGKSRARRVFAAGEISDINELQQVLPDCDLQPLEGFITFAD